MIIKKKNKVKIVIIAILFLFPLKNYAIASPVAKSDSLLYYSIKGKIRNQDHGWIYMGYADQYKRDMKTDSAEIVNGEFIFTGKVSGIQPVIFGVAMKDNKGNTLPSKIYKGPVFLSPGHLSVEGDFNASTPLIAHGTKEQDEYNGYKKDLDMLNYKIRGLIEKIYNTRKTDYKRLDSLNTQYSLVLKEIQTLTISHIYAFPNSLISAYIAQLELRRADPLVIQKVYKTLSESVRNSFYGMELSHLFELTKSTTVGLIAPSFSLPNTANKLISLSSAIGTYTLIDFWASWCTPCRREHPNLIRAYNSYKSKGFKIISISMDTDKAAWLKAIREDQLTWLQLSDLRGIKSEMNTKYGIKTILMNFLIDSEGRIVARDLNGAALRDKLQELFLH